MGDAYGAAIIEHLSRDELARLPQIEDSPTISIEEEEESVHHNHHKENGNAVDIRL